MKMIEVNLYRKKLLEILRGNRFWIARKDRRELLCRGKSHCPESKISVDLRCNPISSFASQSLHNYVSELVHSRPTRWSFTNNAQNNYRRTIEKKGLNWEYIVKLIFSPISPRHCSHTTTLYKLCKWSYTQTISHITVLHFS